MVPQPKVDLPLTLPTSSRVHRGLTERLLSCTYPRKPITKIGLVLTQMFRIPSSTIASAATTSPQTHPNTPRQSLTTSALRPTTSASKTATKVTLPASQPVVRTIRAELRTPSASMSPPPPPPPLLLPRVRLVPPRLIYLVRTLRLGVHLVRAWGRWVLSMDCVSWWVVLWLGLLFCCDATENG